MSNGVIDGVNNVIKALNRLKFKMPDWLGGGSFGINIPTLNRVSIPRLREGSVMKKDTMVEVAEYPGANSGNPEIISPRKLMKETMIEALSEATPEKQNLLQKLSISIGAEQLFDEVIDYINEKTRRTGKCAIKVGG